MQVVSFFWSHWEKFVVLAGVLLVGAVIMFKAWDDDAIVVTAAQQCVCVCVNPKYSITGVGVCAGCPRLVSTA